MKTKKNWLFIGIILGTLLLFAGCNIGSTDNGEENGDPEEIENGENGENGEEDPENTNGDSEDENGNGENGTGEEEPEPEEPDTLAKELGIEEMNQTMHANVDISYREDATHEAEILGEISQRDTVEATGLVANGWIRIEIEGGEAFIHQAFLEEEEINTVTWGTGEMEEEMVVISNPEEIEALTNKELSLPPDYEPEDLVQPNVVWGPVSNYRYLRVEAAEALEDLFNSALEEEITLYGRTGYRSYQAQEEIFVNFVNNHGYEEARTFSAKPGQSEHQTGLAMDITSESVDYRLSGDFGDTVEGQWVAENAHNYGFIIRYPRDKEEITGYIYEPWHLRYVGVDLATEIYESGLTMEEYFGR